MSQFRLSRFVFNMITNSDMGGGGGGFIVSCDGCEKCYRYHFTLALKKVSPPLTKTGDTGEE